MASFKHWVLFIGLGCGIAQAQPPSAGGSGFNTVSRPLEPGDQLEINIFTLPEQEKKYQIRADGTFFHPYAGEVKAAGLTLAQLETVLRQRFRKQIRKPEFRLGMTAMSESEAAVLGEVKNQGKFKFMPGTSLADLIAQAGGISDKADLDGAMLLRAGKQIPVDLNTSGQAALARMTVQKGDILYVNRGLRIGVSGEVQAKGIYAISSKSGHPVTDAVKAAGGATESGALSRVQVIRPSLAQPLEVDLLNPETAAKVTLEDGDTVLIPARRAVVLGAVTKPGTVNLVGKETLIDIIGLAGLDKAKIDNLIVIRSADVSAGNSKKEIYNLESSLKEDAPVVSVRIYDGDVVYVPTKEEAKGIVENASGLMSILWMARSIFSI